MRLCIPGAVICLLVFQCCASPIPDVTKEPAKEQTPSEVQKEGRIEEDTKGVFKSSVSKESESQHLENSEKVQEGSISGELTTSSTREEKKLKEIGRQSDDDEDDDEDDDAFLDVGDDDEDDDDDDDDDDAADDDDDDDVGDYFERLFDDILGEETDDDDEEDEDVSPSTGSQNKPAASAPAAPSQAAEAIAAEANAIEEQGSVVEEAVGDAESANDGNIAEASESVTAIEKDPSVAAVDENIQNTVQDTEVAQAVPTADETEETEDDDDDEDEDAIDTVIGDDDDDDDNETTDDDEDDDDDDDTDLVDIIEAKRARAIQNISPKMPAIYISKYNRFVDNIIGRINRILGKSYDPVRVKLPPYETKKNKITTKRRTTNKSRTKINPVRKTSAMTNKMGDFIIARNNMEEVPLGRSIESESREPAFILISKASTTDDRLKNMTVDVYTRTIPNVVTNKSNNRKNSNNNVNRNKNKSKKKNNTKNTKTKRAPKVRATLLGLSSLKRDKDVTVNMMSDHTTVKSNFILGPLTLRVEREILKNAKRELKSATATTAEMHGRLNLRIIHGGAATLHSIRVLQPKQVRVDSTDDHEKTKEYMWRRSAHIASLVSQKLSAAARSMMKPPPSAQ